MSSDPTDLIRAVDDVHVAGDGRPPNGGPAEKFCKLCQSPWPCEVRRVRDALEAMRTESAELVLSRAELADEAQKLRNWRDGEARENARLAAFAAVTPCSCGAQRARADRAEAALAEANTTIQRLASDVADLAMTREEAAARVRGGYGTDYTAGWDQAIENAVDVIRRAIEGPQS